MAVISNKDLGRFWRFVFACFVLLLVQNGRGEERRRFGVSADWNRRPTCFLQVDTTVSNDHKGFDSIRFIRYFSVEVVEQQR